SITNRIITAKDHASVQLYTCHIVERGIYTVQVCTFVLSGFLRAQFRIYHILGTLWMKLCLC
ncbi:hypothetical protein MKX03_015448, partial [Papaver bracteatum]